jgi:uncharacterized protein
MNVEAKERGTLTTIEKLLVLQDRDRRIKHLTKELDDIPAHKKLIETRLHEHQERVRLGHEELKKKASAAKQLDLEIETNKQQIQKLRAQQGTIKTNQEYRAIENEVAAIQRKIKDLEDQEIAVMEQTETVRNEITELDKALKLEGVSVSAETSTLDARLKNIQAEIEQLKTERNGQTPVIPADWLARYDRTFKHTGDYAVVPVDRSCACGGCHMKLPPQVMQDVKKNLTMIFCTFCGRILYWQP